MGRYDIMEARCPLKETQMKRKVKNCLFCAFVLLIVIVTVLILINMEPDTSRDDVYERVGINTQERISGSLDSLRKGGGNG